MVDKNNRPKMVNIVGPQGVGKTTILDLVKRDLSDRGVYCTSINCTGYGTSPLPLCKLGRITDYSIMLMDRIGRVFPFLGIAGLNSTMLYNFAKYAAMIGNPDIIIMQRNPYLDTYAMGEAVLRRPIPKRLSRALTRTLTYDPLDLLIHLDAVPEVLYERVIKRIEEAPTATDKQRPHLYETVPLLEKIRGGYFGAIKEAYNDGTRILRVDTSELSIPGVLDIVRDSIFELFETEM